MYYINNKGQASEVFRLLIGAIVGLSIFAIIYAVIVQTEQQKVYLQDQILYKKLELAIKNPTSQEILIDNVAVTKNSYINSAMLSYKTGLKKECFSFNSNETGIENNTEGLLFRKDYKINFVIKCDLDEACQVKCAITAKR